MTKYLKSLVLTVAMIFMVAGAAHSVEYAPEGKGDVLIFPFYAAFDGGWETKLTVVNTDRTKSTVAKVVVRSPKYSGELLDFLIYLSPADVWTGTLKYDAGEGSPVLYSDDDSIISDYDFDTDEATFGDEEPANRSLYTSNSAQNLVGDDYAEMGYVYVINASSWVAMEDDEPLEIPLDKQDIVDAYGPFDEDGGSDLAEDSLPGDILAGWMDFNIAGYGVSSLNAVPLKDYNNETKIVPQRETVLAPVSHGFDENPEDPSGGSSDTTLAEIEMALGKQNIAMPYLNSLAGFSAHMFTFPTKYTELDSVEEYLEDDENAMDVESDWPGFTGDDKAATYTGYLYNLQEETIAEETPIWSPAPPEGEQNELPLELNLRLTAGVEFEEGWIDYEFQLPDETPLPSGPDGEGAHYAPTIPVVLDMTTDGMSFKYGAWTQGTTEYGFEN